MIVDNRNLDSLNEGKGADKGEDDRAVSAKRSKGKAIREPRIVVEVGEQSLEMQEEEVGGPGIFCALAMSKDEE